MEDVPSITMSVSSLTANDRW